MTTLAKRGSGTPATTGTTWASVTNAVDGTAGTNPATYATMTNATASAVATIEITGYDFASAIAATDTLNSVTVALRHNENNTGRFASVRFQPYDGATAIGTIFTATLATGARTDTTTFPVTLAQLRSATFKIRVTITGAASTQSRVFSIDQVDVTADYTITPPAITQAAYRFYADGTETGSTVLAAQDTGYTADVTTGDVNLQVRMRLQSTTAIAVPATDDLQLQWEKNSSGTWTNVVTNTTVTNLAPNPSAEVNSTGWVAAINSTIARDGSQGGALATAGSWAMATTSTAASVNFLMQGASPHIPVSPSTVYTASAYTWATIATAPFLRMRIFFYTSAEVYISTTTDVVINAVSSWRRGSLTFTTPSDAGKVRFLFEQTSSASGQQFWVDAVMLTEGPTLLDYFDGATAGASWTGTAHNSASTILIPATGVLPYASANLTDAAATTNRLGAGSGSFVAGKVSEDGRVDDLGWTANNYTELLYSVTLKQADLANGDTLKFRVLRGDLTGATTELTYTQVPTVTITKTAGAAVVTGTAALSLAVTGTVIGRRIVHGTVQWAVSLAGSTVTGTVIRVVTGTAALTLAVSATAIGAVPAPDTVTVIGLWNGLDVIGLQWGATEVVGAQVGADDVIWEAEAAPSVLDDFDRADTTAVGSGGVGLGSNWVRGISGGDGNFHIASNSAVADNNFAAGPMVWNTAMASSDMEVSMRIAHTANTGGAAAAFLRVPATNATTGYAVQLNGGGWGPPGGDVGVYIVRYTDETEVQIAGPYLLGAATGEWDLKLTAIGSTLKAYVDGVERLSVTDTDHTTGNRAGIRTVQNSTGQHLFRWFDAKAL